MANNTFSIPELNPVLFYQTTRANLSKYFTRFLGDFMFNERLYEWQQPSDYIQVWQTDDIINLQFESTFDPITVKLVNENGNAVITLPSLSKIANKYQPGTYCYEANMSLAGLTTGFYYLQLELGASGPSQIIMVSPCQYISSAPLDNTLLIEYYHSKYHNDVIFETGIKFQLRIHGNFGFLDKARKDEFYTDEKWNNTLLNSKSAKQWPVYFGDEFGLPDEMINLLDNIWSCDTVTVDTKLLGIADGTKPEYVTVDDTSHYPKRGMKLTLQEGINRNSKVIALDVDTTKKLVTSVIVDAKVFGDTSNQGSSNVVPVYNIENE
jgi:hypothetical protein